MISTYFTSLKSCLATSAGILRYQIREELVRVDDGVIRLKASLKDGGLLEISEYIVVREGRITRVAYSYHWQDRNGNLKVRWDNEEDVARVIKDVRTERKAQGGGRIHEHRYYIPF